MDEGIISNFAYNVTYNEPRWKDLPPLRHGNGTNFSYADGHSEYWKWTDPRTLDLGNGEGNAGKTHVTPVNPDLVRLQRAMWGKLGYVSATAP